MEKNEKILNLFIEAGKQLRYDFEEIKKDNPHYVDKCQAPRLLGYCNHRFQ
ncbi:MAG TPA: hypothetical protein VEB00_15615 [Clostridia bacterium]|nr:hypothetical protein [Clostridia bacterium]